MTKLHQLLRIVIASATVSLGSIAVGSIPAQATAPSCSNVTISGTLAVGQTLTATPTCTNTPTSYAYQWSRSTTTSGTFTDITGATASTRLLTNEDLAYFLRVTVRATNASGTSVARTSTSTSTAIYLGLEDFVGSSTAGYTDATGTSARFSSPRGIAVDASGNLYVTDNGNDRIRKISTSGVVTTFAGSGTSAFTDGTGTGASFSDLRQITYSPADDSLFVLDGGRIREVAVSTGVVTTLHNRQNIASASRSSTTRTLKFGSAHGYRSGDSVTVAGVNANFDGTFSVSVSSPTQLTYTTTGSGTIAEFAVTGGTTTARFGNDDSNFYGAYYNAFIVGPDNNLYHGRTNAGDSDTNSWLIRFVRVSSNNFRFERVKYGLICSMSFKSSTYLVGNSCGTHVRYTTATANDWTNYTGSTLQSSVNDQVFYASDDYFYSNAFRYTTPASGTATQTRVFASSPGTFWAEQGGFLYVISGNTIRRVFGFTADTTAPTITTYSPSSGSTTASISTNLGITFSENVSAQSGKYIRLCTSTSSCTGSSVGGNVAQVFEATATAVTISGTQVTINPTDLTNGTQYWVSIDSGAFRDGSSNEYAGLTAGATWTFTPASAPPTVSSVTSPTANGSFKVGDQIEIQVNFSEDVTVVGTPQLTLETGGTDRAVDMSASSASTITFTYTVQPGDTSNDLDYTSTAALSTNGGTIRSGTGTDATLTLPAPGAAGSLGNGKSLVVDTTAPTVTSVSSDDANDSYKAGASISIQVTFSEGVSFTGAPQLTLETGTTDRIAAASAGSGSQLTFTYSVQAGDSSPDLDYVSTTALALNGGTITDAAGNNATLTLASPGAANSLGANKAIVIDTTAPTATWTSPATPSSSRTLTYTLAFSETVSDIASGDFSNTGSAGGCSFSPSATSGTSITVTVTCTSDGTVVARLATSGVADVAGNMGPASNADASSVTIDTTSGTTSTTAAPTTTLAPTTTTTTTTIPRTSTTSTTTTTTTTVPLGSVGINSWTMTASPNPVAPGQRFVLTTTIACGRQMSTSAAPYYPSMYYMVRSSPWINGVYGGPTLSDGRRTATFSVTLTAPSQPGNYAMYAYGRDNPFGRTCTGDSYNFANSGTFTLTVGNPTVLATTTTLPAESTTTTSIRIRTPEIPTTTSTTVVRTATTVAVRRITICHATGSTNNPYVSITVDASSLGGHDDHEDDIIPAPASGCPRTLQPGANTRATTTTTLRATSTTAVDTGTVGINSWTITASPNPAQPGEQVVLTTTISCGRRMSTTAPPYYPSMYYMVRSSPWINGVYRGPSLSADGRTATFSVTVTAPSRSGTYGMYAYGRDNPFGRTCTGDSYNFANSQNFSFVVSGDAVSTSTSSSTTTTTTTTTSTTTTTLATQTISICVWQPTSSRPVSGSSGRYVARSIPREDAGEYRGPFNLIPAPVDGCPDRIQLASTATTTMSTTSVAPSSTTTTTLTSVAPTTTTPIYEPPVQASPTTTTLPDEPPATIPARPETVPDPAYVATDGEIEAAIQVVDANEVPSLLSVQGRLVLTSGNFVKVRGKGFDRAGFAEVWLFSTPRLLGRVPKDDSGNFVGRVRIPEGVEEGEHTIELRAVTKRAKVVTVSVPAIVLGADDNSTDDTVATTVPTSPVDIGTATTIASSSATAPLSTSVKTIRIQPGATELVVPIETIVAVVNEILGNSSVASDASVRVRIDTQPWQSFDIRDDSDLVLQLDPSSAALEVEVTPAGGQPIVRSIEIAVRTEGTRWIWWLAVIAMVTTFFVWIVMRRRRHDDDHRRD